MKMYTAPKKAPVEFVKTTKGLDQETKVPKWKKLFAQKTMSLQEQLESQEIYL